MSENEIIELLKNSSTDLCNGILTSEVVKAKRLMLLGSLVDKNKSGIVDAILNAPTRAASNSEDEIKLVELLTI